MLVRAEIRAKSGHASEAQCDIRRAEEHFRRIGTPYELASAHRALARTIASEPARKGEAIAHLQDARRLYETMELPEAVAAVEGEIAALDGTRRIVRESSEGPDLAPFSNIVTQDPGLQESIAMAARLAELDVTILLEGETGTGKELFAQAIHAASPRSEEPFVAVNCAAVPKDLLEGELFGHAKGAFTGAVRDRQGHLTRAGRGTVFLDEIDKSSQDFQTRLLRVLEDREVWPVGADASEPLEATILCATNASTRELREGGRFLPDLYYRLAEFTLRISPLREREGDIKLLAERFLTEHSTRLRTAPSGLSGAAMDALIAHPWPGNVRELRNAIVTAVLNAGDGEAIEVRHLPPDAVLKGASPGTGGRLNDQIERIEREEIISALNAAGGVKATAARILGVSRKGLRDRLKRLGLE
ncbi:MAG TPA: sigma 54-interacting transcriptional regulator [bacterium]|nr:sigma 54-interacting transcriptional regulator [bacterium]